MEFLRRSLAQIQAQLGKLTTSQRVVIFLLVCLTIVGFLWLGNYSAERELVPLLNQSFSADEVNSITQKLDVWNIDYTIKDERIMVARSAQRGLLYKLTAEQALPEDAHIGWSHLIEETNILIPESVREDKRIITRQIVLADVIANFPGVRSAQVIINPGSKRTLNNIAPVASASVHVEMKQSGSGGRKMAMTIADFIASANNRMRRENVTVVVDGQLYPVQAKGEELSSEYLEEKARYEQYFRQKIVDAIGIANAIVQVDAKVRTSRVETRTKKVFQDGEGSWNPNKEQMTREDNSENVTRQEEPGMMANVGEPQVAQGTSQSETMEEGSRVNQPFPGTDDIYEVTPAGGVENITASVRLPWEYFAEIAKQEEGLEEAPDADTVRTIVAREVPNIQSMVMRAIGLEPGQEDRVIVDYYWAQGFAASGGATLPGLAKLAGSTGADGAAADAQGASQIMGLIQSNGKEIAVTVLAMISLMMVLMMVRKAAGPVDMSQEEAAAMIRGSKLTPEAFDVEDSDYGDDENGAGLLAGMEMGEQAVKSQKILAQIREMVKDSPEMAANLIGKWISQE